MTPLTAHLVDQFRLPRGPLGRLAGAIMARRGSNLDRNRWTVDLLELPPSALVLEVGHGPGVALGHALEVVSEGIVVGLDHSATMRAAAARRHRRAVADGRLRLVLGDAQDPPGDLGTFDAVFSCNVWLFWTDPVATIERLTTHLVPGGQLAITHLPRHGGASRIDTVGAGEAIRAQMLAAGLESVECRLLELAPVPAVCVIGRRRDRSGGVGDGVAHDERGGHRPTTVKPNPRPHPRAKAR